MTLLGRKAGGRRAAFSAFPGPGPHRLHPPAPVAAELSQGPAVLAALLDQLQQLRPA